MTREKAKTLLEISLHSERSSIYPLIKEEVKKMNLSENALPFPEEFLFFEPDYLSYYLDIIDRGLPTKRIIDIGCDIGFQSYIFEDFEYIGIEPCSEKFFRDHGNYIKGFFPDVDCDLSNSIVIANLSLGIFGWDEESSDKETANALSKADYLYIKCPETLLDLLIPHFTTIYYLPQKMQIFPRVFLQK